MGADTAGHSPRRRLERLVPAGRVPASTVLAVYCVLLFGVPSRLIVKPIGAAGTPANLWGLFALVWWVCVTISGANPTRRRQPVRVALAVLTMIVFLSYATAMARGWYVRADVREATSDIFDLAPATSGLVRKTMIDAADRGLIAFGSWLGVALVAIDGLRSWEQVQRVVRWFCYAATIMASLGLVQYFTGWNIAALFKIPGLVANDEFGAIDARSVVRRVYATAIHPIEFGVVLAALFPLALHRAIHQPRANSALIPAVAIGLAVPIAVSRSAILVLVSAMAVMFIGWPWQWRRRLLAAMPVAIVGVRLLMPGVVGTIIAFFTHVNDDPSISGRTDDYAISMAVFRDTPIFGRGLGTFIPRFYRILDNQYLRLLIELGVAGLIAVAATFIIAIGCARGARLRAEHAEDRHLALALSAMLISLMLSYATFDAWSAPIASGTTFLGIGLSGAVWRITVEQRRERTQEALLTGASG